MAKNFEFFLNDCKTYLKKNWQILFFAVLYLGSVLVGAGASSGSGDSQSFLTMLVQGYCRLRREQSFKQVFFSSLGTSCIFLVPVFLLGFSAAGSFFLPILAIFKGAGVGALLGYLYLSPAFWQMEPVLWFLCFSLAAESLIFLYALGFSARLSRELADLLRHREGETAVVHTPAYCVVFGGIFLLTGLIAWLAGMFGIWFGQ